MNTTKDLLNIINDIRKYFSGLNLNIEQIIEMYIRSDFKDNILLESSDINKKLVKRKYI